jgi:hypothetical protein
MTFSARAGLTRILTAVHYTQPAMRICGSGAGVRSATERYRFEKLNHFVGAENDRQLAWLPRVANALRDECFVEYDAIEEPQSADGLVQGRPGNARRYEMNPEGATVVQLQFVGRSAKT